ncbi:DHH family phosphoesterase [Desulfovibrio ferrophilus]|uniref:Phosphoesterase RecJ domain-containing protein n=1 Tax=Desulfovibrio ferrophilus TaxID=241368 RepID=A0A2Z6B2T8_9BACT|nr:DHH family phosphoesterase [Desulfovibrio ferrophilus]BBD09755.1 phosphoesterase RecJ domain-containing protein [Desulfovibrio ferrophilus]
MAYFRSLPRTPDLLSLFNKQERWLIAMNADPDAMASAMALKRIMAHRVQDVGIAHVNEVSRPDNLEMIHSLRVPTRKLTPNVIAQYDRFALVDSQPHHHEGFADMKFSVVIDHHPTSKEHPVEAEFAHVEPGYGANSSLLTEYLYNMNIRPGKLLATALQYGIKTDTSSFERDFAEADLRAFQYLNKFASPLLLKKIYRSEFHLEWLRYFCQAYFKMRLMGQGIFAFIEHVESPDILVLLADLFLRVHGASWTVISGVVDDKAIAIFRGDGLRRDMGKFAARCFGDIGSAGGHKGAARAEIAIADIDMPSPEAFLWKRLHTNKARAKKNGAAKQE